MGIYLINIIEKIRLAIPLALARGSFTVLDDYRVIINNSSWFLRTYLRNWLLIFCVSNFENKVLR